MVARSISYVRGYVRRLRDYQNLMQSHATLIWEHANGHNIIIATVRCSYLIKRVALYPSPLFRSSFAWSPEYVLCRLEPIML